MILLKPTLTFHHMVLFLFLNQ